jgi:hypothetical protein
MEEWCCWSLTSVGSSRRGGTERGRWRREHAGGVSKRLALAVLDVGSSLGRKAGEELEPPYLLPEGELDLREGTRPTLAMPALAQSRSDAESASSRAAWCPWRDRALVVWSGAWLVAATPKATSTCQARSIRRELRTPRQ